MDQFKKCTYTLKPAQQKKLKAKAKKMGISASCLLRQMIDKVAKK